MDTACALLHTAGYRPASRHHLELGYGVREHRGSGIRVSKGADGEHSLGKETYIMVDACIDILALLLLLPDEAGCETATTRINDAATLFPLYRGMETEIFATGEPQTSKLFFVTQPLGPELHQRFQLDQGLFDFGHGTCVLRSARPGEAPSLGDPGMPRHTRAVDELAVLGVVLLVCHNEREQGDGFPCARRHLQNTVSTGIERFCEGSATVSQTRFSGYPLFKSHMYLGWESSQQSTNDGPKTMLSEKHTHIVLGAVSEASRDTWEGETHAWIDSRIWKEDGQITASILLERHPPASLHVTYSILNSMMGSLSLPPGVAGGRRAKKVKKNSKEKVGSRVTRTRDEAGFSDRLDP